MPTEKLTDRRIKTVCVRPGGARLELWDTTIPGLGLRVAPDSGQGEGTKTWFVRYRFAGAQRRLKLGTYPTLSLSKAHDAARGVFEGITAGIDPAGERTKAAAPEPEVLTFAKLADRFIDRHAKRHTRSWETTKRHLDKHVAPHWGKRPAAEITRKDVNKLLNDLVDAGTPILANRVLAAVRKLFNWAVGEDELPTSPCIGVKPKAKEQDRERVLSDSELAGVWRAADAIGLPFGPFVKLLMLSLQRRDEVAGMRWDELDLQAKVWALPGKRAKNAKPHLVPLPALAVEILESVPKVELKPGEPSPYVFTTTGATPISGYSRAKNTLDRLVLEGRQKAAKERGEDPEQVKGLEDWRFHDLRRTGSTGLARLRVPKEIRERVLNHVEGRQQKGVAEIYDRYQYLDEKRDALDLWATQVRNILTPPPANVVPLRGGAASG